MGDELRFWPLRRRIGPDVSAHFTIELLAMGWLGSTPIRRQEFLVGKALAAAAPTLTIA